MKIRNWVLAVMSMVFLLSMAMPATAQDRRDYRRHHPRHHRPHRHHPRPVGRPY